MSEKAAPGPPVDQLEPPTTRLESYDEIRRALQVRRQKRKPLPKPGRTPVAVPFSAEPAVQHERPLLRPPLALLCILDDGTQDGEWVRLRAERTVIGRVQGDVVIPHDTMISGQHAEICRQQHGEGHRWVLTDLQSTNGTFVRVSSTILRPGNELIVGRGRYRFEVPAPVKMETPQGDTRPWYGEAVSFQVPSLVEITPGGPVSRLALTQPVYWIGRDPRDCAVARPDDVLVSPKHARLHRDVKGQWHVSNNKSVNGLWLRIEQIVLEGACQIRLGEQRFQFRVS